MTGQGRPTISQEWSTLHRAVPELGDVARFFALIELLIVSARRSHQTVIYRGLQLLLELSLLFSFFAIAELRKFSQSEFQLVLRDTLGFNPVIPFP